MNLSIRNPELAGAQLSRARQDAEDAFMAYQSHTHHEMRIQTRDASRQVAEEPEVIRFTPVTYRTAEEAGGLAVAALDTNTEISLFRVAAKMRKRYTRRGAQDDEPDLHMALLPLLTYRLPIEDADENVVGKSNHFRGNYDIVRRSMDGGEAVLNNEPLGNEADGDPYDVKRLAIPVGAEWLAGDTYLRRHDPAPGTIAIAGLMVLRTKEAFDALCGESKTYSQLKREANRPKELARVDASNAISLRWNGVPASVFTPRDKEALYGDMELKVTSDIVSEEDVVEPGWVRHYIVSEGQGTFIIDGVEHTVSEGTRLTLPAGTSSRFTGDMRITLISLNVDRH